VSAGVALDAPDNIRWLRRPGGKHGAPGRRLKANWQAEIRAGGRRIACTVIDISTSGARLRVEAPTGEPDRLWLLIDNMAPIPAELAWRKGSHVGLYFRQEQPWVKRLEAQRFDPTAWLRHHDC
jgi:PilZ domain